MTAEIVATVGALLLGLGVVRWHKALGRYHFAATAWTPTPRARGIVEQGYFVLGIVMVAGSMLDLIYLALVGLAAD